MTDVSISELYTIMDGRYEMKNGQGQSKKLSHTEMADLIPSGVNFMSCPGGDCGHQRLTNPKSNTRFKSCPDCETNTVPFDANFCPTCGRNHEDDEWDDSDVKLQGGE